MPFCRCFPISDLVVGFGFNLSLTVIQDGGRDDRRQLPAVLGGGGGIVDSPNTCLLFQVVWNGLFLKD